MFGPRHTLAALALLLTSTATSSLFAQHSVSGVVRDPLGNPVRGAAVMSSQAARAEVPVKTDENGRFVLELAPGPQALQVAHPGYATLTHTLNISVERTEIELRLDPLPLFEDSATVVGIRANAAAPVTKRDMDREEIETSSYGQDVPQLLQYTPAMTWYSDSGVGSNYSYFSLRGIKQSRINMTFDGAPLNDPTEQTLYFNNFNDFTRAVDSIQIQRGVGTSSVGAPSFGGSVNFSSRSPSAERGGDARLVLGSYDTVRATAAYETGILDNGFFASGRISFAETDGYREHSGSEHRTFFLDLGWHGERSSLKFVSFSGDERSQLAWLAVDPETLEQNRRFNPLDEAETDHFGQDFAQLRYTRDLGRGTLLTASLYYNGADGWYRLWDDPVAKNQLLEFGIDQAFFGTMVTLGKSRGRLDTTFGVHFNDFSGDHTLDDTASRIYSNTGHKQTANAFAKAEYALGAWILFGDLQYRRADFSYDGDVELGTVDWSFLDPRVGIRYLFSPETSGGLSVYASMGRAQREPTRLDLLLGEDNATLPHDLRAVEPEEVVDFEAGVNYNTARLALQANLYAMEFTNEIALTGELSEVGLPLRQNVDESYRRGLEVDLRWQLGPGWTLLHSANLSRNRIREWTQFYDVYDEQGNWIGSEPITYRNVRPLLTPETVANLGLEWSPGTFRLALMGRYVDDSQLDNTDLADFRTPSFTNVDLRASVDLSRWWPSASPTLALFVNNLFDGDDQYPSGYSYQFLARDDSGRDTLDGIPFYYPRATRNVVLSMSARF